MRNESPNLRAPDRQRRQWLAQSARLAGLSLLSTHAPGWAQAVSARSGEASNRVLILIELKGGNDGLNTLIPFGNPQYAALRPTLALKAGDVLDIQPGLGLHPAMKALMPLWEQRELAIVQGVGYPQPNLSHFRSIEIWDSASSAHETLNEGWITRVMQAGFGAQGGRSGSQFAAEGVVIGLNSMGPLQGARVVSLNNPDVFVNQSRLAKQADVAGTNAALRHVLQIENDIGRAASSLRGPRFEFTTEFPQGGFGNALRAAVQVVASQLPSSGTGSGGVPVITLSLGSFDTHQNQLATHANLLRQLAEGFAALKGALTELRAWDRTLVMTFSEFGRRARQNNSNGTDHGTAAPLFLAGGAVRGGLYGKEPDLERLDATQNLIHTTDFRQVYASLARNWWEVDPRPVVRGDFDPLGFLRS